MRSKALFSNLRISTKLLLLNLMVCAAFFLIVCVILLSFANIQNKLTEVTSRDMGIAISNSQVAREFSEVFSDIELLSHIFYGKDEYLSQKAASCLRL